MRKNDAFHAKIVNTPLMKIVIAVFAPDERLPSSATLAQTNFYFLLLGQNIFLLQNCYLFPSHCLPSGANFQTRLTQEETKQHPISVRIMKI